MTTRDKRGSIAVWAGAAGFLLAGACWAYRDYRAWLRLGAGGLPGSFSGWLRTTRWRVLKLDPLDLTGLRRLRGARGDVASLSALPHRSTRRPRVSPHPVPHRQLDQRAEPELARDLQAAFDAAVAENAEQVMYALSHFEKHTQAITSRSERHDPIQRASRGEIAHIHALDGSMHMILSPSDAVTAIEAGWAELHGLAGRALGLPPTYLLVYAPQDGTDIAVTRLLVRAAVAYMTGFPA